MARYVGIDLGTTNSTVSVANLTLKGDIDVTTLRITQVDEQGMDIIEEESLPSVLYLEQGGTAYVGRYAKRMNSIYTERVIKESKRYMGTDLKWTVDDVDYQAQKVASFFLDIIKKQVEKYYNGETIDSAVITIPANFNFQQQQATKQAGILAGFSKDRIHMIPEPTAALLDFLNEEQKLDRSARRLDLTNGPKKLLVFDLGGGTCDVSILQVEENHLGKLNIEELSISQYMELGGRDFDRTIMIMLFKKYLLELGTTQKEIVQQFGRDVMATLGECFIDIAERAKKRFSAQILASGKDYYQHFANFDPLKYTEMLPGHLPQELIRRITITKKEYDDTIQSLLYKEIDTTQEKNIETPILNALVEARVGVLSPDDIDAVFLVGGMTYYPTVQKRIYDIFGQRIKPLQSINPMLSVSRGAAVYHQRFNDILLMKAEEQANQITKPTELNAPGGIKSTAPNNIFIQVAGANNIALIEKGTVLPYERVFEDVFYVSSVDNGKDTISTMKLDLFTAASANAIKQTKLKEATIKFKKEVKQDSKLVLKVSCNFEKEVKVRAWLADDPTEMLEVNIGEKDYSPEEIKQLQEQHKRTNHLKNLEMGV